MGININFGALLPKFGQQTSNTYNKPTTFAGSPQQAFTPDMFNAANHKARGRKTEVPPDEDTSGGNGGVEY